MKVEGNRIVINAFTRLRQLAGLSKQSLSMKSGLHAGSISNIENCPEKDPRLSSILSYVKACGYKVMLVPEDSKQIVNVQANIYHLIEESQGVASENTLSLKIDTTVKSDTIDVEFDATPS